MASGAGSGAKGWRAQTARMAMSPDRGPVSPAQRHSAVMVYTGGYNPVSDHRRTDEKGWLVAGEAFDRVWVEMVGVAM